MAEVGLVASELERGQHTLVALENAHVPVDAAFWSLGDDGEWRFYIHTKMLRNNSKKSVYKKIRDAILDKYGTLRLREITLLSDNAEILKLLRIVVKTNVDGFHNIHIKDVTVNGVYIKEVMVYRM